MASLKWVKLTTGFYKDAKIKKVLRTAGGDRVVFFWVLLLALAGELNHSGYLQDDDDVYTCEMLADETDFRPSFVRKSIQILIEKGLLNRTEDGVLYIPNWDKHQSEDKLEKIRENARLRQQACRERHRAKQAEPSRDSNVTVTPQNKKEKEKENQNQNEMIIMNNNNPPFSYAEPSQPLSVSNDLCVDPNHSLPYMPPSGREVANPQGFDGGSSLPPALAQTVTAFCEGLTELDNPRETHTLLLAWLSSLKEKNRLPSTTALPLLLDKLPPMAKESKMTLPAYLQEAICRGWNNFYPVPTFATQKSAVVKNHSNSYDINELEAMI